MDIKKLLNDAKAKINEVLEKEETKQAIEKAKESAQKVKKAFDDSCEKADTQIKAYLEKKKGEKAKLEAVSKEKAEEVKVEESAETVSEEKTEEVKVEESAETVSEEKTEEVKVEESAESKENGDSQNLKDIENLKLTDKVLSVLADENIITVADLKGAGIEKVSEIKGIGKATLDKLEKLV